MELSRCSTCEKLQGTCLCSGCKKYFCMPDFRSHRVGLANEMDSIISDRDSIQDRINKSSENLVDNNRLLLEITEWEEETVRKVRKTAELVRQQVTALQNSKQQEIKIQLDKISKDLIHMKETEDFVEPDLSRLRQNIQQLNQDLNLLNQPQTIELCTEGSNKINWDRLIYVQEPSKSTNNRSNSDNTESKRSGRIRNVRLTAPSVWDDDMERNNVSVKRLPFGTLFKRPSASAKLTNRNNRIQASPLWDQAENDDFSWSQSSPRTYSSEEEW